MKKAIAIFLMLTMILCAFSGCSPKESNGEDNYSKEEQSTLKENDENGVKIPEILGTDIESAKTIVLNMGLVPIVEEDFSEGYAKGYVMGCSPETGKTVEKGTSVTITVSKGRWSVVALTANGTFNSAHENIILMDGWNVTYAEISNVDNTLSVTLQINGLALQGNYGYVWLISESGNDAFASLSSDFTVASRASYENTITPYINTSISKNATYDAYQQTVNLTIPLDVFNVDLPTTVWIKIPTFNHLGDERPILFKLNFTWDTSVNVLNENDIF